MGFRSATPMTISAGATTTATSTIPDGVLAGDRVFAFVGTGAATPVTVTPPAGWVQDGPVFQPSGFLASGVWHHDITSPAEAGTTVTWTWSTSSRTFISLEAYSGADLGRAPAVDVKQGNAGSAGPTSAPAVVLPSSDWLKTYAAARQSPGTDDAKSWSISPTDTLRSGAYQTTTGTGQKLIAAAFDSAGMVTAGAPVEDVPASTSVGPQAPPVNAFNQLVTSPRTYLIGATQKKDELGYWQPKLAGLDWMRIFPDSDNLPPDWDDSRIGFCQAFNAMPFLSAKVDGDATKLAALATYLKAMPSWILDHPDPDFCVWLTDRHEPEGDLAGGPAAYKANMVKAWNMIQDLPASIRGRVKFGPVLTRQYTENTAGRSYADYDPNIGDFFGVDAYMNSWNPAAATDVATTFVNAVSFLAGFKAYRFDPSDTRVRVMPELGAIGIPNDVDGTQRAAWIQAVDAEIRSWTVGAQGWAFAGWIWWNAQGKSGSGTKGDLNGAGKLRWFNLDRRHNGTSNPDDPRGGYDIIASTPAPGAGAGSGGGSSATGRSVSTSVPVASSHVWSVSVPMTVDAPVDPGTVNPWQVLGLPLAFSAALMDDYDALVLGDSPEGYWRLDGTGGGLLDLAGNGHNATNYGSVAGSFISGGAAVFNGTSAYVEVPNSAAFSPVTNAITAEAWVAPAVRTFTVMQGDEQYIHWMGVDGVTPDDDLNSEWIARMYRETPTVEPERSNRISGYSFNLTPTPDNPNHLGSGSYFQDEIVVDEFIHYALVINPATGLVKVYKNGELRDSDPLSSFNITPEHGLAPLRFGTASRESFLQGRIARAAIYTRELTRAELVAHYRQMVPPAPGTAQWERRTGQAFGRSTGTRLRITVGAEGVLAGATLIADTGSTYTAGGAVMNDSRGNLWTRERTGADSGTTLRGAQFRGQIKTALRAGDKIELRTSAGTVARVLTVNEYSGLLFDTPVHAQNAVSSTGTTPGSTMLLPTMEVDTLVCGSLIVGGPVSDTYTADVLHDFVDRARVGSSTGDGSDLWVAAVSKNAITAGTQRWTPTISPSRPSVEILCAYLTGTPVWTPPAQGTGQLVAELAGVNSSATSATLTVNLAGVGVPVGHTVIVTLNADYTATAPTMTDSAGNTWVPDRTAAVATNVARVAVFRCRVTTPIPAGATLIITWASAISRKAVLVQQYSGLMVPTVIDAQDGVAASTGSPAQTLTTTNPNTLIISAVGMAGPVDALYDSDISWIEDRTIGTTSGSPATSNRTLYSSHKAFAAAGPVTFTPVLNGGYAYASLLVAYRAA